MNIRQFHNIDENFRTMKQNLIIILNFQKFFVLFQNLSQDK